MARPALRDRSFDELTIRELHDLLRLRVDVFVVEQDCAYPELDGRDTESSTRHVWITDPDREPRAYLRVLDEGAEQRIGRVVVRRGHRGSGLARHLVEHVIGTYPGPWVLDAQTYLSDWYERLGFAVAGTEFVEFGVAHVPMRRARP